MNNIEIETFTGTGGQTRYKCPYPQCGFDTYSLEGLKKHWLKSHRTQSTVPQAPLLFDADENPIALQEREIDAELPEQLRDISTSTTRRRRNS